MKSRDIISRLCKEGWVLDRTRGSHQQYKHPEKSGRVTVPHPKKTFPLGLSKASIVKQVGHGVMIYPIVIHKDPSSDYGVTVPDLPGCFSAGTTLDDAMQQAREAIEFHIEGLLLEGEDIPPPTSIETHQHCQDYDDGLWALVDIDLTQMSGKSQRVNISVPDLLLKKIDAHVKSMGSNRSSFLVSAALDKIQQTNE